MTLPKDWFERTHAKLVELKVLMRECPACKTDQLLLADKPAAMLLVTPGSQDLTGNASTLALVACGKCGYSQLHNLRLLNVESS